MTELFIEYSLYWQYYVDLATDHEPFMINLDVSAFYKRTSGTVLMILASGQRLL